MLDHYSLPIAVKGIPHIRAVSMELGPEINGNVSGT